MRQNLFLNSTWNSLIVAVSGSSNLDASWDPVWEAQTRVDSSGWTAELRIPLSQLRFSRAREQTWGLQVRRYVHRLNEESSWAFWRQTESGGPAYYGHLDGIVTQRSGRR